MMVQNVLWGLDNLFQLLHLTPVIVVVDATATVLDAQVWQTLNAILAKTTLC